jgi:site-specific recombinase XerD
MPSKLEKQGNKWTFRYYENGKQYRKTIQAYTHKEALNLQLNFLSDLTVSKTKLKNISFTIFCKEYLAYSTAHNRPKTITNTNAIINTFNAFLHSQNINSILEITTKTAEDYKLNRLKTVSHSTVNREIKTIKAIFTKALQWGYLHTNPLKEVKTFKLTLKKPRFLSHDESKTLINTAPTQLYKTMITIALYTGFRLAEICSLQWQDIDFISDTISVNPKHGFTPKSNEFRTIPLNQYLKSYLLPLKQSAKEYIVPQTLNINTLSHYLSDIFQQAKIKDASFHTLRHTFASNLIIAGVNLFTVSKLLGHSDIKTTMIYAHLSKDHLKNSVDILNYN